MKIDKAEIEKIQESAAEILLALGKVDTVHDRDDWPGAHSLVMFSLGEITGSAHRIRKCVDRIREKLMTV